jgi:predicted O-methyltransferase YrrM
MTEAPGALLRQLVLGQRARTTIETGFALGLSSLFILEGLLEQGDDARHTVIDPFQQRDWRSAGLRTVRDAGAEPFVRLIEQDSTLALPALIAAGERFDLAFVDGGHHFEVALMDLAFMLRLVRPGGLVVIDDLWMPAVRAAVNYATTNLRAEALHDPARDPAAAKRFAILRVPEGRDPRPWDHFVPFW